MVQVFVPGVVRDKVRFVFPVNVKLALDLVVVKELKRPVEIKKFENSELCVAKR